MYAKIKDGAVEQYPYRLTEFRKEHPNVSIPRGWPASVLERFGIHEVEPTAAPVIDQTAQVLREAGPALDGGRWRQSWEIVALPADEIRSRKITQARTEGRRRRVALSPAGPDEYDLFLAVTMAKVYRVSRGRGRGQEETELENLMLVVDQITAIKAAEETIIAEIEASPDPASIDVPNSPHWPRITP